MATLKQIPNFTPQQMDLFQRLLAALGPGAEQGAGFLSRLASGEEGAFEGLEAPYYSALQRGIADTANRFSQFGAQDSSAFQNMLAGQSEQLAETLGSQRTALQQAAIERLLESSANLLGQRPYENLLKPKRPGFGSAFGRGLGSALGNLPKMFLGGL